MDITPHLDAIAFLGAAGTAITGGIAAIVYRELRHYRTRVSHLLDRIAALKGESGEFEDLSRNLAEKLDEARTHNATLTDDLANANTVISALKKANTEKYNTITALRLGLDDAEKEAAELRKVNEHSQQIIDEARAANEALANAKAEDFQEYLTNAQKITFSEYNEAKKQKLRNTFKGA